MVLVEQGQSGQDYRACANVPDVNHRTDPPVHPLPTCQDVIDAIGNSTVFSALDIKAGFHNIPLDEDSKCYCGIITQDGVWVYDRMAFGFLGAPATFQAIIEHIIKSIPGGVQAEVYIDDIHPHGTQVEAVWQDSLKVVGALVDHRFMINLSKCHFIVADLVVLGFKLF